jgi:hypothetical protein
MMGIATPAASAPSIVPVPATPVSRQQRRAAERKTEKVRLRPIQEARLAQRTAAHSGTHGRRARADAAGGLGDARSRARTSTLTQENLATMLGSGRPRINALFAAPEQGDLIRRFRGRIRLLNRTGLEGRACECYRQLSRR